MGKYVVLCYAPFELNFCLPEAPSDDGGTAPVVNTLREAENVFRYWVRDSGNDYIRADGSYPWADVVRREAWDGISYGDITGGDGVCRFERSGPRGGIRRENF